MGASGRPRGGDGAPSRPGRATLLRYLGFQLPGWLLAACFAGGAWEWFGVPAWAAAGSVGLWMLKDLVMFRFVWRAYAPRTAAAPNDLRERLGVAETEIAPEGRVRVGAERWRARTQGAPIAIGSPVRVLQVEGLTLVVGPAEPGAEG